jgi:hypothetical protein
VLLVEGGVSDMRHPADEMERRTACFRELVRATVGGAGHMMQRHKPRELAGVIDTFLG